MANKDKLETISVAVDGIVANQQNQWNALNTIAERVGISLKDDGTFLMESVNTEVPRLGLQSDGQTGAPSAPDQAMDVDTFAAAVLTKFKKDPPPVDLGKQKVSIDITSIVSTNNSLFDTVTKPWNDWFIKFRRAMLKIHGYKEVKVGDDVILAVDDIPEIPPNPFHEETVSEPTNKPADKSHAKSAFWPIAWTIITSRTLGYLIAVIAVLLALHEQQQCQKFEEDAKRYKIYRTIYRSSEEDRKVYEYFDSEIEKHGTDKVLKHVQKRDREMQLQQSWDKKI